MKKINKFDIEPKGYKNLFLQILQLKNFLWVAGGGAGTFMLIYAEKDKWLRVQQLFFAWTITIVIWFLAILFIYGNELGKRVISYIVALTKQTVPILLITLSLYLILLPFESRKFFGTLILVFTVLTFLRQGGKLSELSENLSRKKKNNMPTRNTKRIVNLTGWTATETNNEQGASYREINLGGRPLKTLEFRVKPSTVFWRAGFKISDPNGSILPLRTSNSFLFHIGSTDSRSKFGITAYINGEWDPNLNKTIDFDNEHFISIKFEVNKKNFIKCFINNKVEYKPKERIDPSILEKVFLAAWGDGNPYRVEFDDIEITFR